MAEEYTVVDSETGAPAKVRKVVSSFKTPSQQLEALRKFFPDAESTSGTELGDDNFLYTDPSTNSPTLYNPSGFDSGDLIEYGREAFMIPAGVAGGAVALAAGQMGPQIALPEEILTIPAGAALASEGAGQIYDRVMDYMLPEPFSVNRGPVAEQVADAAGNVAAEMIGGKIGNVIMEKAGGAIGGGIRRTFGVNPERQASASKQAIQALNLDVELPTAGIATQSPILMFLENRLSQLPTGMVPLKEKFQVFKTSVVDAAQKISRKYGDPLTEGGEIGKVVKKGAEKAKENFEAQSKKLYDAAYDLAPSAKGRLGNIIELKNKLIIKLEEAPESLKPSMQSALKNIDNLIKDSEVAGGLSLSTIRELRTNIRLASDSSGQGLVGMTRPEQRYYKQLYSALTDDMNEAVVNAGGEKASAALSKADNYYRNRMKFDMEPIVNEILKKDLDLQAFNFLMQGSKESNQRLAATLRNMPKETRKVISASIIERLGMLNPAGGEIVEDFSMAKFLTNYKKIANSSKDSLFGKNNDYRKDLDTLVDIFENVKSAESYANPSKTGDMIGALATFAPFFPAYEMAGSGDLVGGAAGAVTATIGLVPPYYASKLLGSPSFVKWLINSGPKIMKNPSNASFHFGRLLEISSRDTDTRDAISSYIKAIPSSLVGEASASEAPEEDSIENSNTGSIKSIIQNLTQSSKEKILATQQ
tara:strand:+ start:663 stop:2771 length:2109 start_codon:yes stop_codon:yes gene_type:complete